MIRKAIPIINSLGLHARPAAQIVKIAATSKAKLWIEKDGQRVNGKSIMGVMMLAAEKGSSVLVEVDGDGEEALLQALIELFQNKFNEE